MKGFLYVEKNSFFHALHPSVKILGLLISFIWALSFNHPGYIAILWVLSFILSAPSGVMTSLKRVGILFFLIGFASFLLWLLFYSEGEVLLKIGPFEFKDKAILYALGMSLRLTLMMFFGLVFLSSTRVEDFSYGLSALGVPFPVSFALSLSFRLVPIFIESLEMIIQAQEARGLEFETKNLVQKARNYVPLIIPVFVSALRRTDRLSIALETKGFGAKRKRTNYYQYSFGAREIVFLSTMLIIVFVTIYFRIIGLGKL